MSLPAGDMAFKLHIAVEWLSGHDTRCDVCNGTGKIEDMWGDDKPCHYCHGFSRIPDPLPRVPKDLHDHMIAAWVEFWNARRPKEEFLDGGMNI